MRQLTSWGACFATRAARAPGPTAPVFATSRTTISPFQSQIGTEREKDRQHGTTSPPVKFPQCVVLSRGPRAWHGMSPQSAQSGEALTTARTKLNSLFPASGRRDVSLPGCLGHFLGSLQEHLTSIASSDPGSTSWWKFTQLDRNCTSLSSRTSRVTTAEGCSVNQAGQTRGHRTLLGPHGCLGRGSLLPPKTVME